MIGDNLPDEDHVVRYVKPSSVGKKGKVYGSGFCLRSSRSDDKGLSVNWLESFSDLTKNEQLAKIRKLLRLKMAENGCLAELNVGQTKQYVGSELESLRFLHTPLNAEGDFEADPSHSEIGGLPPGDSEQGELIGDMIASCIKDTHPAVAP